jgi:predicted nucleic-acid-binding Zn-ribbon protein
MFYSYDKKRDENMKIRAIFNKYPDEESYKLTFIEHRMKVGVVCKKCDYNEHYWLNNKDYFEYKECKFRATLRSGTVLQSSI